MKANLAVHDVHTWGQASAVDAASAQPAFASCLGTASHNSRLGPSCGPDLGHQQRIADPIHLAHRSRVKVNLVRAQITRPSGSVAVLWPTAMTLTDRPSKPTTALAATSVRELPPTSTLFSRGENYDNSIRTISLSP